MRITVFFSLLLAGSCALAQSAVQVSQVRDSYPQLSPDGTQIVFQSNRGGSNQVWVMARDGSSLRQLAPGAFAEAETPTWSPDGRFIAFAAYVEEGNNDVFIMRADGSSSRRLTEGPGYDGHPHWTFDGRRIVFNSDRDTPDPAADWSDRWHDIWSVDVESGTLVKHTDCRAVCTYGSLSPDGAQLLYRRVDASAGLDWSQQAIARNSEIVVAPVQGGEVRTLAAHPAFDGWPSWSADGKWVVFTSNRGERPLSGQVWRVRPDGTGLQRLTYGDWGHAQPNWSADGASIAAYRFQESETAEYGGIALIPLPVD